MTHDDVKSISVTRRDWIGEFEMENFGEWIDYALLLVSVQDENFTKSLFVNLLHTSFLV